MKREDTNKKDYLLLKVANSLVGIKKQCNLLLLIF